MPTGNRIYEIQVYLVASDNNDTNIGPPRTTVRLKGKTSGEWHSKNENLVIMQNSLHIDVVLYILVK